jgi:hypothetical protein
MPVTRSKTRKVNHEALHKFIGRELSKASPIKASRRPPLSRRKTGGRIVKEAERKFKARR